MITVITGPMFASKSKRLIQYLTGALTRKISVTALTPEQDNRTSAGHIYSYDGSAFPATTIRSEGEYQFVEGIVKQLQASGRHILAVDEVQFLEQDTVDLLRSCYSSSPNWLILTGLVEDSDGGAFGYLHDVINIHETDFGFFLEELTARCSFCHGVANRTHCKSKKTGQVLVGRDNYEPRCEACWTFGNG
jgi:thymidine kinase